MTALERMDLPVQGYTDNGEFLEAKIAEVILQLECAALRRRLSQRALYRWADSEAEETDPSPPMEQTQRRLACAERELLRHLAVADARLESSDSQTIPFLELRERFELSAVDQQALWLLFFKAISTEFRERYEALKMCRYGNESDDEICVGNLLEILSCTGVVASLRLRARFSVEAPLLVHHLVRVSRYTSADTSVLDAELQITPRMVGWLSGDTRHYVNDSPCLVERPQESLEQVVLEGDDLPRLTRLIDHHAEALDQQDAMSPNGAAGYGRALAILEHGPSGTGKTLLARALAHRMGKPLVSLRRPHGIDDADLEYLFREARLQDGIVFIDECESLCVEQSDELVVLLRELERFEGIVLMATNRPQALVPQLDRRFTMKVPFGLPSIAARERIWRQHLGSTPVEESVDLTQVARDYPLAGGYIKNAVLAATTEALARDGDLCLNQTDLEGACQLQAQHVGQVARLACREHRLPRRTGIYLPEALKERLASVARGISRQDVTLADWGLASVSSAHGARVLFYGEDWVTVMWAAESVASQLNRKVVRFDAEELAEAASSGVVDAGSTRRAMRDAARSGEIVILCDTAGTLGESNAEAANRVVNLVRQVYRGLLFVASHARRVSAAPVLGLFHEVVSIPLATCETREAQWRDTLGDRSADIDTARLARKFELHPGEIRMVLEKAGIQAGAGDEVELTTDLLITCAQSVAGQPADMGLFG